MKKLSLFMICALAVFLNQVRAQSGKSMVFNGSSNYITVADHSDLDIDPGEDYTITCWIRTSEWRNMPVFRKRDANNYGYEMTVGSNGNYSVNIRSTNNTNVGPASSPAPHMALNQWYHLAMVVNVSDKTVKIYRNAELQQSSTNTGIGTLSFNTAVDITIGHSAAQSRYFIGEMDDIRVWSKAFTASELLTDMTTASVSSATVSLLSAWDFENVTGTTVPDVSGNGHSGTISGPVVLPVNFISFKGNAHGNMVKLEWQTSSEHNNSYFEIERSSNKTGFSPIIRVAATLNNDPVKAYQAFDINPLSGTNYYRLKQVDLNGEFTYHRNVIAVPVLSGSQVKQAIYPNPANQFTTIKLPEGEQPMFEILDLNGTKYPVTYQKNADEYIISTSLLNNGLYLLKTKTAKGVFVDRLIVSKTK